MLEKTKTKTKTNIETTNFSFVLANQVSKIDKRNNYYFLILNTNYYNNEKI